VWGRGGGEEARGGRAVDEQSQQQSEASTTETNKNDESHAPYVREGGRAWVDSVDTLLFLSRLF
jgi:hypothetical protein